MADTYLFQATAIYKAPHYVFNDPNNIIDFNAPKIDAFTPRQCWLRRYLVAGQNQVQYLLTFEVTSADLLDPNILTGIYVEQDGMGVMIDCISIANFNSVANGDTATITPRYGTPPAFTTPTPSYYCVTRSDDGSGYAHDQVVMQYVGQYIGNVRMKSNVSGVSVYQFQTYTVPIAIGTDTIAAC